LAKRGLALNEDKTQIRHILEGFNFLGFTIIQHDGRCFTFPQKEKVLQFVKKNNDWLKRHPAASAEQVVKHFNVQLKGWGNYYRHGASKRVFSYVDDQLYRRLWLWIRRKHKKHLHRMANKYFQPSKYGWKFKAETKNRREEKQTVTINRLMGIPITRHVKVKGTASPDDPSLTQ
jgi:RNA-directed DNA polymerase